MTTRMYRIDILDRSSAEWCEAILGGGVRSMHSSFWRAQREVESMIRDAGVPRADIRIVELPAAERRMGR